MQVKEFCIDPQYTSRPTPSFHDDTQFESNLFQREVYEHAHKAAEEHNVDCVTDIGCGSGFKLLKYLGDFHTLGLDLPPTVEWLQKRHPDRQWAVSDLSKKIVRRGLVIASDVIEHLVDPDELLDFIVNMEPRVVVISTPDRTLMQEVQKGWCPGGTMSGPPWNTAHVREWTVDEFAQYIGTRFVIDEHFISNKSQATQCVVCRVK